MTLPPLILASASPRRAGLLRQLGVAFRIVPSRVAEVKHGHLSPQELCRLNAHLKARSVAQRFPGALVLGADTIVFLDDEPLGKPADLAHAREMLQRLQGRTHQVVTGVALMHLRVRRRRSFAVTSEVKFRRLTPTQITAYLARVNPLDKAGAYAIQECGDWIVEKVTGSYTNVVGLPLERLREELGAWSARHHDV